MAKSTTYYLRKSHRWLGLIIGIQFLAWTVSGIYFAWNDIDEIHGDHLRSFPETELHLQHVISPSDLDLNYTYSKPSSRIEAVELIDFLGKPVYQVTTAGPQSQTYAMYDAITGVKISPITEEEAVQLAEDQFQPEAEISDVSLINSVSAGHEYRSQPLPAWRIAYDDEAGTRVYVSADQGEVIRFRTERWRWFDWLWMMHIMDYNERDDFNNLLLKSFSVFGLATVLSGFTLFGVTAYHRRRRNSN